MVNLERAHDLLKQQLNKLPVKAVHSVVEAVLEGRDYSSTANSVINEIAMNTCYSYPGACQEISASHAKMIATGLLEDVLANIFSFVKSIPLMLPTENETLEDTYKREHTYVECMERLATCAYGSDSYFYSMTDYSKDSIPTQSFAGWRIRAWHPNESLEEGSFGWKYEPEWPFGTGSSPVL